MLVIVLIGLLAFYPVLRFWFDPYDTHSGNFDWFHVFMWIMWLVLLEFDIALITTQ